MNDLEISKALALAIGWQRALLSSQGIVVYTGHQLDRVKSNGIWLKGWRIFDYRDWNIAGPIAERYDCFPIGLGNKSWNSRFMWRGCGVCANTPQKAIALAVIGAKK